jgi:hypothetical protein
VEEQRDKTDHTTVTVSNEKEKKLEEKKVVRRKEAII